ncbi:rRNA maturation RNase YbeY [Sporolactobacillus shoreae]|uniref:Endoribonuclease YbeY n=1 Tax=Sporolactobacillus shoreae TaxID=1465501 RepID=A0A4Z0GTI9_9BACL|nr:rRNA maturation RNase YbeY [Sporolactobacillus shoreae]TGA99586.1 rRNA maturation RNase YbeY [Sporolactobacillus shoreae]
MTMTIDLHDDTEELSEEQQQWVIKLIDHAVDILQLSGEIDCSLTFVGNARIQEINREYRGIDRPTDVISFALEEMADDEVPIMPEEGEPRVLGDIIVSIDKAREQAVTYEHSFERELGFLVVHGLLHLLGYDHTTESEEKEMFGLQEEILSTFGLNRN